jgi:prepilin-type N-terminal cleavage/methylation domain-containing protein
MRTRSAGFTLIELMIAVTIIGMLATVALPAFQRYQLRSRMAERELIIAQMHKGVEAYLVQQNRFPQDLGLGLSFLWCGPNPPAAPGTGKHVFQLTLDDWSRLGAIPEGSLHFQYQLSGLAAGANRSYTMEAFGDLDGDGIQSQFRRVYNETAGVITLNDWSNEAVGGIGPY